jgi:LysR family transcriptional regulator (chromosome initiation inhibitor)
MLDAKQLEALAAVVEHGGFGPAAKALSLTLAAVSLRIKTLEAQLGQRLLVRGKAVRATAAGQALLAHIKQLRSMEADLLAQLPGAQGSGVGRARWHSLAVAINADSLASWFLPGLAALLLKQRLLLDITIDDQDHTHDALRSGDVIGCVTTLSTAMRGCVAEPLGLVRYRCVAAPALAARCRDARGRFSVHRLLAQPAIIFNRKDALQDAYLQRHFGLRDAQYPRHFAPAVDAFEKAIALGLGWGMVPDVPRDAALPWEEVVPDATVDVALYWQHWARESLSAQRLTAAVKAAAAERLLPMPPEAA